MYNYLINKIKLLTDKKIIKESFLIKSIFLYLLVIVIISSLSCSTYLKYINSIEQNLKNESRYISNKLEDVLENASQLLMHLSKQITAADTDDTSTIAKIIGKSRDEKDNLTGLNVGWIDKNNMYVYGRNVGMIEPPCHLADRPYLKNCIKSPGIFYTSQVVIGAFIGIKKVPGGIGVTDRKGNYVGTLCMGIELADLARKVQQEINMSNFYEANINYVVLDKDFHIVLQSYNDNSDIESSYYKNNLSEEEFVTKEGRLSTPIFHNGITFTHYKKVENFPYYIIVGTNYITSFLNFLQKLLPVGLCIVSLLIICGFLLFLNRKKILEQAAIAEGAKQKFLDDLKAEHLNILKEEITRSSVNEIYEAVSSLYQFIPENLNVSAVNITKIIKECIIIQSQKALWHQIKIRTFFAQDELKLHCDKLYLKQIILGILSLSIETLKANAHKKFIKIYTNITKINNNDFVQIIIEDNGLALGKEKIKELQERGQWNYDNISFTLHIIEELIRIQNGHSLDIETSRNSGKKIIIAFPCAIEDYPTPPFKLSDKPSSNVIKLKPSTMH